MQNQQKIKEIQEQKKRLRDRIEKLNNTVSESELNANEEKSNKNYEETMAILMEKKKRLEQEKQKQVVYKKMQEEYIERRKQMERQKRMQQLKNQKRMIELEAGMKRMVFEGVKEKVKGVNSEQLMIRAMLRDGHEPPSVKPYTSKGNVRRDFEQFLETTQNREIKQKWDIYELNEKRFEIFQKKQETIMREVLLRQLIARDLTEDANVMKMSRQELEEKLEQFGVAIEDYMQVMPKQSVIEAMPNIEKISKQRIKQLEKLKKIEEEESRVNEKYKAKLKQQLLLSPTETVKISRSIVYDLINNVVYDYEKRLNRFQIPDFENMKKELQKRYENVLMESEEYEYAKLITLQLLEKVHDEFIEETAEEMSKLHNFAHDRTEECFEWMFRQGTSIPAKLKDIGKVDFKLNFKDEEDRGPEKPTQKNQLKKEDYLSKFEDYQTNIFDVDKLTTQLINEINLLEGEIKYFQQISIKIHGEKPGPDSIFHILYDRQLYALTNEAVYNTKKNNKLQKLGINDKLPILHWKKFHNFWFIHDSEKVSIYSPWGLEILKNEIGERISNLSGKIVSVEIFPIFTVIGFVCSVMLGFEKGQILKYNFNLNRVENTQTNHSIYTPILPQIKTGEEPPFPLQKKNVIKVTSKKLTQKVEIHEFREFFDHHTTAVVSIKFYKHNCFITVDKSMKCAIWYYDNREGVKCYKPVYVFEFVCSYFVYKEAENPKFKNIFPGDKINDSPSALFKKWLQTEGFLKKQVYNNPKKRTAYYRSDEGDVDGETPLWKFNYDENQKKVLKIYESYYSKIVGKMEAKSAKIWRQYLMILCERDHVIRDDLKTVKIYGWDIEQKKMRSIGVEFDIYKNQTNAEFQILDSMLVGVNMHLMAVVSSGRILIFSLLSGQLLRNVADVEFLENAKYASYSFSEITADRSFLGASTKTSIMEISLNDHNASEQQKHLNDIIQEARRKYINLI